MDPKLLGENGWKAVVTKFNVKDNGLQRALSVYEKLADDKYAERLKAIGTVNQLAANLKKVKEVAAIPEVVKYLTDVVSAAESDRKEIDAAAAVAAKAATAGAGKPPRRAYQPGQLCWFKGQEAPRYR